MAAVIHRHGTRRTVTHFMTFRLGQVGINRGIASLVHGFLISLEKGQVKHVAIRPNSKRGFPRPRHSVFDEAAICAAIRRTLDYYFRRNTSLGPKVGDQFWDSHIVSFSPSAKSSTSYPRLGTFQIRKQALAETQRQVS